MGRREDGFTIYDLRSFSNNYDKTIIDFRKTSQIVNSKKH